MASVSKLYMGQVPENPTQGFYYYPEIEKKFASPSKAIKTFFKLVVKVGIIFHKFVLIENTNAYVA